ncbi:sulfurtransferase TusA family protein [Isoptericola jiangsuensis]|uniref:sulfurtransferase TusA family protein n=1 Tax=Isoptericola jiangsuensis TaxID=548579 RepID=UPI003AAA8CB6
MSGVAGAAEPPAGEGRHQVDARGLRCPLPVVRLAAVARDLPTGSIVSVLATDPAARHDVPAWARMRGHVMEGEELVDTPDTSATPRDAGQPATRHDAVWRLTVRLGAAG